MNKTHTGQASGGRGQCRGSPAGARGWAQGGLRSTTAAGRAEQKLLGTAGGQGRARGRSVGTGRDLLKLEASLTGFAYLAQFLLCDKLNLLLSMT